MVNRSWTDPRSLRSQLLLAVNIPLIALAAAYLAYDFRRELSDRMREKRIALDEEAKTILPAIEAIKAQGREEIQSYVDEVCARMSNEDSPGHHIVVILPNSIVQAKAHHRASGEIVAAMNRAASSPERTARVADREIIVGRHELSGKSVLISEGMEPLRRSVWRHLIGRVAGFLVLVGVTGMLINYVILRLVTVPVGRLVATVRELAAGRLGARTEPRGSAEFQFLASEINNLSEELEAADRYRSLQMSRAREIQQHTLPRADSLPGLAIASVFVPADEVGGDYYDVIPAKDGSVLICVADVSGHGVAAAMLALLARSLLRAAVEEEDALPAMMARVNRRFAEATMPGDFATVALVRISPRSGRLEYVSAGHESCWVVPRHGAPVALESTGLIMGIAADATWESKSVDFSDSDWLVMLTDGVTEAHSEQGELFGRDRLLKVLSQARGDSIDEAAEMIRRNLREFRGTRKQTDDITVVLASCSS